MGIPRAVLSAILSLKAQLASVRPAHVATLMEISREIVEALEARLKTLSPGRYTTQEVRVVLSQVRALVELLGAEMGERIGGEVEELARVAAAAGRDGLVAQIEAWGPEFAGSVRQLVDAAAASEILDPGALEYYETSKQTYGMDAITRMRRVLAKAALEGATVAQTVEKIATEIEIPEWKAERIVRTEQSYASSRRQILDMIDAFGDEAEVEWRKQLIATLDDRTGEDSKYVNGQTRGLTEEFEDNEGRKYQHPPNRPNDREVLVFLPPGAPAT